MSDKFIINTSALIYNDEGQILYIRRSPKEKEASGMMGYVGGRIEYDKDDIQKGTESINNSLEKNLAREVKEEVDLDISKSEKHYFHSHSFTSSEGDYVTVVKFIVKLPENAKIKIDNDDTVDYGWINKEEVDSMDTIEIVKLAYRKAFEEIEKLKYHEHIEVAAIVVNEKNEFLILKESSTGKYIFPHGPVENLPGRTWEILEKNLIRNIFAQTAVEVSDGMIPFTDKEFVGKDGFEKIIQFFICKYSRGEAMVTDPYKYSEVAWKSIKDLKEDDFRPLVYTVYQKAFEFINKINN